jgi:hypothetical protein
MRATNKDGAPPRFDQSQRSLHAAAAGPVRAGGFVGPTGRKSVLIGDRVLRYDPASYFISAVDTPATGQVIETSAARPYLAIGFTLDVQAVAALLVDHEPAVGGQGFTTSPANDDLLDAWRRMMQLLDRPVEMPVFAAMLEREILFRLLQGPQGTKLRQIACADSRLSQIRRAIAWIRAHYREPIRAGHLAELAHMSNAAFHRVSPSLQGGGGHESNPISKANPPA